jgi:glycosyltransferase involved in cell wall biosynthesis
MVKKYNVDKNTYLLPTGLEPDFFNHSQFELENFRGLMEQMYPPLRGRRILIYAGRITKEKNVGFLLNILPGITAKHPEVVLLVIGNGPDLPELQKECERLELTEHCVFTGYLERKDLALAYAMSDIFVFPSLTETQGLVTLEAMYSGIPVVAIGSMGTIMVMGGDNGGFMVKNDPDEFTARVLDLLEDYNLYRNKALDAQNHAKNWMIDTMTVKLVEIYQKTMAKFPGKTGKPA